MRQKKKENKKHFSLSNVHKLKPYPLGCGLFEFSCFNFGSSRNPNKPTFLSVGNPQGFLDFDTKKKEFLNFDIFLTYNKK